jgi:hypothetical protein
MGGLFPEQLVNSPHLAPLREWIRNLALLNDANRWDSIGQITGFWVIPKKYIVIPTKYFFQQLRQFWINDVFRIKVPGSKGGQEGLNPELLNT